MEMHSAMKDSSFKGLSVAVIDDHDVIRLGIKRVLSSVLDPENIHESTTIAGAIALISHTQIDITLLDLSLGDASGLDIIRHSSENNLNTRFIVVSMHDSEPYISRALDLGARAYISKRLVLRELVHAIEQVLKGEIYIGEDIKVKLSEYKQRRQASGYLSLTDREIDVFSQLTKGSQVKDVARTLNIAVKTVHVHRRNIMSKLGCKNDLELTKLAIGIGDVSATELC